MIGGNVSKINLAKLSKEEQDKIAIDLAASGVAFKERLNQPVVPEIIAREQPEHLREYFMERLRHYRQLSLQLPKASDPQYVEMAEANKK
ncbi:DNA polymerase III subunit theta [Salmonella enterica]|nr:DNA polymerase III subunit theta [Salmonella enterica]